MTASDKARNKAEELKGRAKEAAGRAAGDPNLEVEGRSEKTKAGARQTFEKAKETIKGAFKRD